MGYFILILEINAHKCLYFKMKITEIWYLSEDRKHALTIVNVYYSCAYNEKKLMWEELIKSKREEENMVWCVVGDCNAIRKPEEMKGSS